MLGRLLCSTYLKTKNMLISIREFNKFHLMDRVIYNEQDCFINNMVARDSDGNRIYDILPEALDENGRRKGWPVPRNEFNKKFCWFNVQNGLTSHYRWWKRYWYKIQLREMMERIKFIRGE